MKKLNKKLLLLIFLFSFLVRFWGLNYPNSFYFDEVYHAFTAREMARGNKAAWEWWNTPPKGFAYEWTHPPLAKLGMAVGILLFGESAFGWRFFGALFGVGCVLLVYLLGRKLFGPRVAIFASFLFALDGLPLVMSRIGMNDIYFLFFALLALWLFLEDKYLLAGLAFGLSLSSKWTAVYLLPILGLKWLIDFLRQKKRKKFDYLKNNFFLFIFAFLLIPTAIYLFSYFLFFTSGHDFTAWWGLQKQMFWYHTRLSATHPFTSSWWSWPIMKRPVWFFVDYGKEKIANIYAMGNPLIWWGGLLALPFAIWQAIRKRNKKLGLIVLAYFALFLPWAFSPRIMFIYHYLPSIPFLCLMLGWTLGELWSKKLEIGISKKSREASSSKLEIERWILGYLTLVALVFLFFYSHWTGIHVPKWLDNFYYWFPSWK